MKTEIFKANENVQNILKAQAVIPADVEECSTPALVSPVRKYIKRYINVNNFTNISDMTTAVINEIVAPSGNKHVFSASYYALSPTAKGVIDDFLIGMFRTSTGDSAYVKNAMVAQRAIGLLNITNETLDSLKRANSIYSDRTWFDKFGSDDMINFPKAIQECSNIKALIDNTMDDDFIGFLLEMYANTTDNNKKNKLIDLMNITDIANDLNKTLSSLSDKSKIYSTTGDQSNALFSGTSYHPIDINVLYSSIFTAFKNMLNNVFQPANANYEITANTIMNNISNANLPVNTLENLKLLLEGAYYGVSTDRNDSSAMNALVNTYHQFIYIANTYKLDTTSVKCKDLARALLPVNYLCTVTNIHITQVLQLLSPQLANTLTEGFNTRSLTVVTDSNINSAEITATMIMDYTLNIPLGTYLIGVARNSNVVKRFSKAILPSLSYETLKAASMYSSSLDYQDINNYLSKHLGTISDPNSVIAIKELAAAVETIIL